MKFILKLLALIPSIRPNQFKPRELRLNRLQEPWRDLAFANVGFAYDCIEHEALCIYQQMSFATFYPLVSVEAAMPPFQAVNQQLLATVIRAPGP